VFEGITYIVLVIVTVMNGLMFEFIDLDGGGWRLVALLGGLVSILALNGLVTQTPRLLLGYLAFYVSVLPSYHRIRLINSIRRWPFYWQ